MGMVYDTKTYDDTSLAVKRYLNPFFGATDSNGGSVYQKYVYTDISICQYLAEERKMTNHYHIKNVIFNDPATIVFWYDGTKTVVKAQGDDIFDPEKGLAMAIAKKAMGNKGNYCNELKKWLPKG